MRYLLGAMIVLAVVDAVLHFAIDAFVNRTFTNLPYGPLFVALPIGYIVLIVLLLRTRSASITTHRLVTAALAIYAAIPTRCLLRSDWRTLQPFSARDDLQAN